MGSVLMYIYYYQDDLIHSWKRYPGFNVNNSILIKRLLLTEGFLFSEFQFISDGSWIYIKVLMVLIKFIKCSTLMILIKFIKCSLSIHSFRFM